MELRGIDHLLIEAWFQAELSRGLFVSCSASLCQAQIDTISTSNDKHFSLLMLVSFHYDLDYLLIVYLICKLCSCS